MGMFGLREETWWLSSKIDKKWDFSGRCCCGGFVMPKECEDKLEELKQKYGEPPEDLEWDI